jgi:hypothetical protein
MFVVLTYFHRKIGPLVFYSYPKNSLDKELSTKIANIMDQLFDEGFFTHSFENFKSINYYFKIPSDWARGNKELLMLSIIVDQQISPEIEEIRIITPERLVGLPKTILKLCEMYGKEMQSTEDIFTGLYIDDLSDHDENDKERIRKNESLIKVWVGNLYWEIVENARKKNEISEFKELDSEEDIPLKEFLSSDTILLFVDSKQYRIWIWEGKKTTIRMKFISAKIAASIKDRYGIAYKITTVDEGYETREFKELVSVEKKALSKVENSLVLVIAEELSSSDIYRLHLSKKFLKLRGFESITCTNIITALKIIEERYNEISMVVFFRSKKDKDKDFFPYPYIFKPPTTPGDIGLEGQLQVKAKVLKTESLENVPYCKYCGGILVKGESICHVCGNKVD